MNICLLAAKRNGDFGTRGAAGAVVASPSAHRLDVGRRSSPSVVSSCPRPTCVACACLMRYNSQPPRLGGSSAAAPDEYGIWLARPVFFWTTQETNRPLSCAYATCETVQAVGGGGVALQPPTRSALFERRYISRCYARDRHGSRKKGERARRARAERRFPALLGLAREKDRATPKKKNLRANARKTKTPPQKKRKNDTPKSIKTPKND